MTTSEQLIPYVTNKISEAMEEVLKLPREKINVETSFSDYGIDSLVSVQLIGSVNALLNIKLRATALFDHVNILSLAKFIAASFKEEISKNVQEQRLIQEKKFTSVEGLFAQPKNSLQRNSFIAETSLKKTIPEQDGNDNSRLFSLIKQVADGSSNITFSSDFAYENMVCLQEHVIYQRPLMPADAYIEMLAIAWESVSNNKGFEVEEFSLVNPLFSHKQAVHELKLHFAPVEKGYEFGIFSIENGTWFLHAKGLIKELKITDTHSPTLTMETLPYTLSPEIIYDKDSSLISLGAFYRTIQSINYDEKKAIAYLNCSPCYAQYRDRFLTNPSIIDGILTVVLSLARVKVSQPLELRDFLFLPISIRSLTLHKSLIEDKYVASIETKFLSEEEGVFDAYLYSENKLVMTIKELRVRKTLKNTLFSGSSPRLKEDLYPAQDDTRRVNANATAPTASIHSLNSKSNSDKEDIAIIGMSCRFPGARNLDEFWNNLAEGKSTITEIPAERWASEKYYDPDLTQLDKSNSRWGGFIEGVKDFSPRFFEISGFEAGRMDPQQRLFLEESWKALEDAGYANEKISNERCSVFVGAAAGDYQRILQQHSPLRHAQEFWGNNSSLIASRISYFLNLKGAAVAVDTACSSSLVALHLGCQSLSSGESDLVITGGVFTLLTPTFHILASNAGMLSSDGKCHTFDNDANGFVPSEGVGVVVLKPLAAALRDKDNIYAVIKGTGTNQDGKTYGVTAPSALAQTELEVAVYEKANINPKNISYVEAHGTGTKLGDPIEIAGLTDAFRKYTDNRNYCAIGSVKTNIGHTSTAAGIAGVIKVALAMKHKKIPPSLNFKQPNKHIPFEESPFYVNTDLKDWQRIDDRPLLATVSSFGFSGTNCHVVMEEGPEFILSEQQTKPFYLLTLSAKHPDSLTQRIADLHAYLKKHPRLPLEPIAYTLNATRIHFGYRCAMVVSSKEELQEIVEQVQQGKKPNNYFISKEKVSKEQEPLFKELLCKLIQDIQSAQIDSESYREKLHAMADLYIRGYEPDWTVLHKGERHQKISLPTYPFLKERYWVEQEGMSSGIETKTALAASLHPLLDANVSTLKTQCFVKTFTGEEFYLKDHQINDVPILPGVAYLEMARAAGALASPEQQVMGLRNIVWAQPIQITEQEKGAGKKVQIALYSTESGVEFEVTSCTNEAVSSPVIHAQGNIIYGEKQVAQEKITHNIGVIKDRCCSRQMADEIYERVQSTSLSLGKSFQPIQEIFSNNRETLSRLQLPVHGSPEGEKFVLHPSILDGALQTAFVGLTKDKLSLSLPFSLGKLEIIGPLPSLCYVYATKESAELSQFRVHILDEEGQVLLTINDLFALPYKDEQSSQKKKLALDLKGTGSSAEFPINVVATPQLTETQDALLLQKVQTKIVEVVSKLFEIKAKELDINEELSQYGADSLSLLGLTSQVNTIYRLELSPATLYEHTKISSFSRYLVEYHRANLAQYHRDLELQNFSQQVEATAEMSNSAVTSPSRLQLSSRSDRSAKAITSSFNEDIAVIGMSGVFPGSPDLDTFWDNLIAEKDLIQEIPKERWDWQAYYGDKENETKAKWGGFIEGIDQFDPAFFNISPREAQSMDPQHRLFLKTVWHAIENSGYTPQQLSTIRTGVFVGASTHDYAELLQKAGETLAYSAFGTAHSILANRVSYLLNLKGPSEIIDTACSSSLVALHHAIKSIQTGDCDAAIAGGVNAVLTPTLHISFSDAGMLSADGRCKTFDKAANGFVRSEGVGVILIKPLSKARLDGDRIYGVIKGSAINHGGNVNSLTTPNLNAHAELITTAIERSNVGVETISYIETHGTGTSLGDPIEINGLKKAFKSLQERQGKESIPTHYCGLGAVKTNIGHLEAAAGIAGVIKILLSMHHKKIPANVHFKELNNYIDLKNSPFYVINKNQIWSQLADAQGNPLPRRAGVSSFGAGGTNAHILIEEGPEYILSQQQTKPFYLLTLSAKHPDSLRQRIDDLHAYLKKHSALPLEPIAYTLNTARTHFAYRCAMVVSSRDELQEILEQVQQNKIPSNYFVAKDKVPKEQEPLYKEILSKLLKDIQSAQMNSDSYREKLHAIADLYIKGYEPDWTVLHKGEGHQKINLPTYPFLKGRYWVGQEGVSSDIETETALPVEDLHPLETPLNYYRPQWMVSPSLPPQIAQHTSQRVLAVTYPEGSPLLALVTKAHAEGEVKKIVYKEGSSWVELLEECEAADLVYFLTPSLQIEGNKGNSRGQEILLSLFHFLKALVQKDWVQHSSTLKVVTFDACPVNDHDKVSSYAAGMLGLVQTFSHEYSHLSVSCIDVPSKGLETEEPQILMDALLAGTIHKPTIALRNGKLYEQVIEPVIFQEATTNPPFKKGGTYLIVGGGGGIGFALSQHLAGSYNAQLVWIGRQPEETYQDKIAEIQSLGGQVLYCQTDVADEEGMRSAIKQAKLRFKGINGAIHSALVLKDKSLVNMDEATFSAALTPKVAGSMVLAQVLKNEPLDFLLFFSSLQSFLANAGQSNYAVGCFFQDAFAKALQYTSAYPVKVINWGYWGSVGIVATPEYSKRLAKCGLLSIEPPEGIKAIYQALAYPISQLVAIKEKSLFLEEFGLDKSRQVVVAPSNGHSYLESAIQGMDRGTKAFPKGKPITIEVLNSWGQKLLLFAFQKMGAFNQASERYTKAQLKEQLKIIPSYECLLDALLDILLRGNLLRKDENELILNVQNGKELHLDLELLTKERDTLSQQYSQLQPHINLLWNCVMAYPNVLTGNQSHMEILFPEGSMAQLESIYKSLPITDYYNQQMAHAIEAYVREHYKQEPDTTITILEVGAGTGATTACALKALAELKAPIKYVYTDISLGFIHHGASKWKEQYPWMVFQRLDIEKSPQAQEFAVQSVDVVLATNVLHATKKLEVTLKHVKQLLKTNGLVVLNELSQRHDFGTLIFGLTDGWWLFEDGEYRIPFSPLLKRGQWENLFRRAGFRIPTLTNKILNIEKKTDQQIILAESDGVMTIDNILLKPQKQEVNEIVLPSIKNKIIEHSQPVPHTLPIKREVKLGIEDSFVQSLKTQPLPESNSTVMQASILTDDALLLEMVQAQFVGIVSRFLRIEPQKLDMNEELDTYGMDSITLLGLTKQVNNFYRLELSPAILFDHPTIHKFSNYLVTHHRSDMVQCHAEQAPSRSTENGEVPNAAINSMMLDQQIEAQ